MKMIADGLAFPDRSGPDGFIILDPVVHRSRFARRTRWNVVRRGRSCRYSVIIVLRGH